MSNKPLSKFYGIESLKQRYNDLKKECNHQIRGYELEKIIYSLLELNNWESLYENHRNTGEQIDLIGRFEFNNYFFECKWRKSKIDALYFRNFYAILELNSPTIRGVMISPTGYTKGAISEGTKALLKRVIVFIDDEDLNMIFNNETSFNELFQFKLKQVEFSNNILSRVGKEKISTYPNFLNLIDKKSAVGIDDNVFWQMPYLYEKPNVYSKMIDILEKYNILIIIGDPLMGKTYTALYILYQYYLNGYLPLWIKDNTDIDTYLMLSKSYQKSIIYIEDPFGKSKYEKITDSIPSMKSFIKSIKDSNSKIIITSRSTNYYDQILHIGEKYTIQLKVNLIISKKEDYTSYDELTLRQILFNYIEIFQPIWKSVQSELLIKEIVKLLKCPYEIMNYVNITKNINDIEELFSNIPVAKESLHISEMEIKTLMSYHEKILLLLIYIINDKLIVENYYIPIINSVKKEYYIIENQIDPFNTVHRKLEDNWIKIEKYNDVEIIDFPHSYKKEAIYHSLDTRENILLYKRIIRHLLSSNENYIVKKIIDSLFFNIRYYNELKEEFKVIVYNSIQNKNIIILEHFINRINEKIQYAEGSLQSLIIEIGKVDEPSLYHKILILINNHFLIINEKIRNNLLLLFINEKYESIYDILFSVIFKNIRIVDKKIIENILILKNIRRDSVKKILTKSICRYYRKLPHRIKKMLIYLYKNSDYPIRNIIIDNINNKVINDKELIQLNELNKDHKLSSIVNNEINITVNMLTKAIINSKIEEVNIDNNTATAISYMVLNFFGDNHRIIDHVLHTDERDIFYILEDYNLLFSDREEVILYDGREWRINYWVLNIQNINKYSKMKITEVTPDDDIMDYETLYNKVFIQYHSNLINKTRIQKENISEYSYESIKGYPKFVGGYEKYHIPETLMYPQKDSIKYRLNKNKQEYDTIIGKKCKSCKKGKYIKVQRTEDYYYILCNNCSNIDSIII